MRKRTLRETTLLARIAIAAAALAALLAPAPAVAKKPAISCGDVVTGTVKLESDLVDCPGDALIVGADDVTIDLEGHTIDGTGAGAFHVGINNEAGHDGLAVRNGTIQEFFKAISSGLPGSTADGGRVRNVLFLHNRFGMTAFGDGNRLCRNAAIGPGGPASSGGISVSGNGNWLLGNTVIGTNEALVANGSDNDVERNVSSGNEVGIAAGVGTGSDVEHNSITGSSATGILLNDFDGGDVSRNLVANGAANGIDVLLGSEGNRIRRNAVLSNAGTGIFIEPGSAANALERNVASGNGGDGVTVLDPLTLLVRNAANGNGGYGIQAVPGTLGGNNRAHGNGNPSQCLNVSCK